jgi:hypothetical protein
MKFYLARYDKISGDFIDDIPLPNVNAEIVRQQFGLKGDEYPGDCLDVETKHIAWLNEHVILHHFDVHIDLDQFDYVVEVRSD